MKNLILILSLFLYSLFSLAQNPKRNVIIFIGDGYGVSAKTAARMAMGQGNKGSIFYTDSAFQILAADKLKYTATLTTHSKNSWITDSAPGSTVYACGKKGKVDNEAIAFDIDSNQPIETILEMAKKNGYAVGLVTTTRITHATPADFGSHIWYRDLEDYIAAQYISKSQAEYEAIFNSSPRDSFRYNAQRDWELPKPKIGVEIDVLLGGGANRFTPKNKTSENNIVKDSHNSSMRTAGNDTVKMGLGKGKREDDIDLIEISKQRGYTYINSRDALNHLDLNQFSPTNNKKLIGLFSDDHCHYEQDRQHKFEWEPSLYEMTQIAIKILQRKSKKGFFLMVEGGRIDHLEHNNAGGVGIHENDSIYVLESDTLTYFDEQIRLGKHSVPRNPDVYGSDYLIKEVLAFDYAIEEGRKFMNKKSNGNTLIFSTSDHECGGLAVVGLNDKNDLLTGIRTYVQENTQRGKKVATPVGILRGDSLIGNRWFPEYELYSFQGKLWPSPASKDARRIVISYGSNPFVNGNGKYLQHIAKIGNHTPQDVWVGADDNVNGVFARRITGRGLLDNTYIMPVMAEFLNIKLGKDW